MNRLTKSTGAVSLAAAALGLTGCDSQAVGRANQNTASPAATTEVAPAKKAFANVDGTRIAYQVYGDLEAGKTPLAVLHGSLMSAQSMEPMIAPVITSRPVIAIDARGHGRTGDVPGPITQERMADDVAAVVRSLGLRKVDLLGYSMGATTALIAAARHPDLFDKQVVVSGVSKRGGWIPAAQASFEKWNARMFAGTPIEAAYKRDSATPDAFPAVIDKLRQTETANYDVSLEALRSIAGKTMIVAGDHDGLQLKHALDMFKARGGGDSKAVLQGFLPGSPAARLAILPATSHIGMYEEGRLLAQLVVPFLDDQRPPRASGFFQGMDEAPQQAEGR